MTLPCAARSTLVYLERGDAPRCTKALSPFNQTSWQEMWCPGVILGPSNTQLRVSECLMWGYNMIFSQLNGDPCPAWTTERGKLKRGWSPGDSLNLVRVLSVRVNYSQQCRNDINGRWEYSKSIITNFKNSPKFQIFEFWNGHYTRHTFWSCLIRCANMKWIQWVLLKIHSRHDSVHRRTDGQTDKVIPVYPPFNFLEARGIITS